MNTFTNEQWHITDLEMAREMADIEKPYREAKVRNGMTLFSVVSDTGAIIFLSRSKMDCILMGEAMADEYLEERAREEQILKAEEKRAEDERKAIEEQKRLKAEEREKWKAAMQELLWRQNVFEYIATPFEGACLLRIKQSSEAFMVRDDMSTMDELLTDDSGGFPHIFIGGQPISFYSISDYFHDLCSLVGRHDKWNHYSRFIGSPEGPASQFLNICKENWIESVTNYCPVPLGSGKLKNFLEKHDICVGYDRNTILERWEVSKRVELERQSQDNTFLNDIVPLLQSMEDKELSPWSLHGVQADTAVKIRKLLNQLSDERLCEIAQLLEPQK